MIKNNFYFRKVVISVVLFFLSFILFLSTVCPNLYWRDAGEFQAVAYLLGIAHPAGSPLYALVVKFFTFLPFGSIAFKVNLASAFFGALLIPLAFLLIMECLKILFPTQSGKILSLASGIIAVAFYGVSDSLWDISRQAEVYTFQNCFIVLISLLLVRGLRKFEKTSLYAASLLLGLSFGSHIIMLLYVPAFFIFLAIFYRKTLSFSRLGIIITFLILGASIYLYLPVRSSVNPYWDWGNPENVQNFITHVTDQKDAKYHTYFLTGRLIQVLKSYGKYYVEDFGLLGIFLGLIGLSIFFRKNPKLCLSLGLFFFSQWFFFIRYWGSSTAFIATFIFFTLAIGIGFCAAFENLQSFLKKKYLTRVVSFSLATIAIIQIFFVGASHWGKNDRSSYWVPHNFFKSIYDQMDFKGVIIVSIYQFGTSYLQQCEKYRPDVTNLFLSEILAPQFFNTVTRERYPLIKISPAAGARIGGGIINANIKDHAFYWDPTARNKYYKLVESNLLPDGFLFSITPSPCAISSVAINNHTKKIEEYIKTVFCETFRCRDEEENLWYASILSNQSVFFTGKKENLIGITYRKLAHKLVPENVSILNALGADYAHIGNFKQAEIYFKKALDIASHEITTLRNLGQLYLDTRDYQQAIFYYQKLLKEKPDTPQVFFKMGFCYEKIGKMEEARQSFRKVILLRPKSAIAKRAEERLSHIGNQ